jgi:hypothetical protein
MIYAPLENVPACLAHRIDPKSANPLLGPML